ncbi:hypothetical protein M9Y10_040334 [Tritrichomonas musculus]|uniref:F5/8 type C domain-containing protein n=1 Tax=Tritrichomonas musculus TaxID=1915356 RepID=A0ABR2GQL5_9EUKA
MISNYLFEIPIANFRRLVEQDYSDKFYITYDSSSQNKYFFELTRNEARVISKKINNICTIDPTIDQYDLSFPDSNQRIEKEEIKQLFNLIVQSTRSQVSIPNEKQKQFSMILFLLGEEAPSSSNTFDIQNIKEAISLLNTETNFIAINYLSEHFLELLESGETKNLNEQILYSLIDEYTEKNFKKEEVSKIFSIMKSQEDKEFVIHFIIRLLISQNSVFFTKEMIDYFTDNLDDDIVTNDLSSITILLHQLLNRIEKGSDSKIIDCNFTGDELSGIVSYLKKTLGTNFQNSLNISCGGYTSLICPITNIIQYDNDKISTYCFNDSGGTPKSESDSWIEFDFGKRSINLSSYTMRVGNNNKNSYYKPKSWRIVGSNDHEKWNILDHRENCSTLNGVERQGRFVCKKSDGFYRYIRYIQEDSWGSPYKYAFLFRCIELFGSILETFP